MNMPADLVLRNAAVLTIDPSLPKAESVAIKGSRIMSVGSKEDLDALKGPETQVIDCQGKTVLPGFNDAHCHPLALGSGLLSVDCRPTAVRSIADLQHEIRQQADRVPEGTWIKAVGYNEFYLVEKRHPNRWDLDEAAPHHPVKLTHRTGHACVLNSLALHLAGISSSTPEPAGGLLERDLETGEPNGILVGMKDLVDKALPSESQEEKDQGMRLANEQFLSQGITSVQDGSWTDSLQRWETLCDMTERGIFLPRVSVMIGHEALQEFRDRGLSTGSGDDKLRLGAVKLLIDEVSGRLNPSQEDLNRRVMEAQGAGFQVAIHCVEERTVEAAIIALDRTLAKDPRMDHRHRLEHCSVCPPNLQGWLRSLEVVVVTQPLFLYYGGERYLETVPTDQLPHLYAIGSWVERGIPVAAGSDAPVVPLHTLAGVHAAVTRRSQTGEVLGPDQALSPNDALRMHTLGGAHASFEEEVKGSITPGKLADLVVLSDDPSRVDPDAIKDIEVVMTLIDGKVVWEK